jgi:hypothetical protein
MPEHKAISDANRHEAKHADTASAGQYLQANGDGTTSFVTPPTIPVLPEGLFSPIYLYNEVKDDIPLTAETPTFQALNTLEIPADTPAGVYELKVTVTYSSADTNDSVFFRVSSGITQGIIYRKEPKDAEDLDIFSVTVPFVHAGGAETFTLEGSATTGIATDPIIGYSLVTWERKL